MLRKLFFTFMITLGVICAYGQTPPPDDEEDNIPIDGGISLLAVAGLAYATRKVYNLRKK